MRAAPAVSVRCTGGLGWRVGCALLPVLAFMVLVVWAFGHLGQAGLAAWIGAFLAGSLLSWVRLRRQCHVQALVWDGQRWTVDGIEGSLAVMLDTGRWMLLCLRNGSRPSARWVAVSAHEAGAAWHLLRAAVFAVPPPILGAGRTRDGGTGRG